MHYKDFLNNWSIKSLTIYNSESKEYKLGDIELDENKVISDIKSVFNNKTGNIDYFILIDKDEQVIKAVSGQNFEIIPR